MTAKKKKVLTINRAKWRRGNRGEGETQLLNANGFMCCLGFDALACGLPKKKILGVADPCDVKVSERSLYGKTRLRITPDDWFAGDRDNAPACADAITANDDDGITERVRETRVRKALIALGWDDVRFV